MLEFAHVDNVTRIATIAIRNKASTVLTETLLKYIPDDIREQFVSNIVNNIGFITKPNDYISLFSEDI